METTGDSKENGQGTQGSAEQIRVIDPTPPPHSGGVGQREAPQGGGPAVNKRRGCAMPLVKYRPVMDSCGEYFEMRIEEDGCMDLIFPMHGTTILVMAENVERVLEDMKSALLRLV